MIATITGYLFLICIGLFFFAQPRVPKGDKRYKTGYKNNETVPEKSDSDRFIQKYSIIIGCISAVIWFIANKLS